MRFFQVEWKMNVPNALSLFRILLLPVFAVLYMMSDAYPPLVFWACGVLVLSGLTDTFDGLIARKFNQITDLGKLLDPLADKLTQLTVVICLTIRYPIILYLLVICLIKELCQVIGGLFLLYRGVEIHGARWFGKVSTFVFYGAMAMIVLWTDMPTGLTIALVAIVAIMMLFAFFNYMRMFFSIKKTMPSQKKTSHNTKSV